MKLCTNFQVKQVLGGRPTSKQCLEDPDAVMVSVELVTTRPESSTPRAYTPCPPGKAESGGDPDTMNVELPMVGAIQMIITKPVFHYTCDLMTWFKVS